MGHPAAGGRPADPGALPGPSAMAAPGGSGWPLSPRRIHRRPHSGTVADVPGSVPDRPDHSSGQSGNGWPGRRATRPIPTAAAGTGSAALATPALQSLRRSPPTATRYQIGRQPWREPRRLTVAESPINVLSSEGMIGPRFVLDLMANAEALVPAGPIRSRGSSLATSGDVPAADVGRLVEAGDPCCELIYISAGGRSSWRRV
jgi:hypothetical protein